MSLISTTDDLGGSYRRFRCSSKYIHESSPADDGRCPPCIAPGSSMLKLSGLRLAQSGGPTARVSVPPFYLKTEEDPASETL
jgi:hypothetical protein